MNRLDTICTNKTAFTSFEDLVTNHPGYRPSTDISDPDMVLLADAYDKHMAKIGDSRRAYRFGTPQAIDTQKTRKQRKTKKTFSDLAKRCKSEHKRAKAKALKLTTGKQHLVNREVEILTVNKKGERIDRIEGVFISVHKLTGKAIKEYVLNNSARYIAFDGGFDCFDSLQSMFAGEDYDPNFYNWDIGVYDAKDIYTNSL